MTWISVFRTFCDSTVLSCSPRELELDRVDCILILLGFPFLECETAYRFAPKKHSFGREYCLLMTIRFSSLPKFIFNPNFTFTGIALRRSHILFMFLWGVSGTPEAQLTHILFQVSLPNPRNLSHKSSFIPRTCNSWIVLPSSCFPESYNLPSFNSKISKIDLISSTS